MVFSGEAILDKHIIKAHPDVKYKCKVHGCQYLFGTWRGFTNHIKKYNGVTLQNCDFCSEIFSTEQEKQDHEVNHDVSLYPYRCEFCKKYRKRSCDLQKHLNWACVLNPQHIMVCYYCQRKVKGTPNFIFHLKEKHAMKGDSLCFKCQILFHDEDDLEAHLNQNKCKKGG